MIHSVSRELGTLNIYFQPAHYACVCVSTCARRKKIFSESLKTLDYFFRNLWSEGDMSRFNGERTYDGMGTCNICEQNTISLSVTAKETAIQ